MKRLACHLFRISLRICEHLPVRCLYRIPGYLEFFFLLEPDIVDGIATKFKRGFDSGVRNAFYAFRENNSSQFLKDLRTLIEEQETLNIR